MKQLPIYLLGALITQAIPIITLPVLTRHLEPSEYGLLVLVQALALFSSSFFSFGLTNTFERNFFDREAVGNNKFTLFWSASAGNIALGLLGSLIFACIAPALSVSILKSEVSPYFVGLACVGSTLRINLQLSLSLFRNQSLGKSFFTLSVLDAIVYSALVIGWLTFSGRKQLAVVEAQFFSTLLIMSLANIFIARSHPVGFDFRLLRDSLRLGYPTSIRQIVNFVSGTADKIILNHVTSLNAVGLYSIAQRAASVCFYFITAIDSAFLPKVWELMFDKGNEARVRSVQIGRLLTPYFLLSAAVASAIIIFSREAILLLADSSYEPAIPIVGWLTVFYLLQFFGKLHGRQIMFGKITWATVWISLLSVGLLFAISYPLAKSFGLIGLTFGTLVSGALVLLVANFIAQKQFRIEWELGRLFSAIALLLLLQVISLKISSLSNWQMVVGLKVLLFIASICFLASLLGWSKVSVFVRKRIGR